MISGTKAFWMIRWVKKRINKIQNKSTANCNCNKCFKEFHYKLTTFEQPAL